MDILKKSAVFLLFLLFFLGGFYMSETISQKKMDKIASDEKQYQSQLQQTLTMAKNNAKQNVCFSTQGGTAAGDIKESKVYFSSKISQLSGTETEITIFLMGGAAMKIDASDLVMNYTDNLKILEIQPGESFPSYPRKLSENGVITITGIASLDGDSIKLGEPNKTFVTIKVEKTGDVKQKGTITVNKTDTDAFLQGNSIFDPSQTFEKIEL